jgi:hypothetical protein
MLELAGAIFFTIFGHLFHSARWAMFIRPFSSVNPSSVYQALSFGYLVDCLAPFNIGEVVKALLLSRKSGLRFSYVLVTVIADRLFDIIFLAVLFIGLGAFEYFPLSAATQFGSIVLLTLISLWVLSQFSAPRRWVYVCSSIFNEEIKSNLLYAAWSVFLVFRSLIHTVDKTRFLVFTFLMWTCYLSALFLVGAYFFPGVIDKEFPHILLKTYSLQNVGSSILSTHLELFLGNRTSQFTVASTFLLVWVLPLLGIVSYTFLRDSRSLKRGSIAGTMTKVRGVFFQSPGGIIVLPLESKRDQLNFFFEFFTAQNPDAAVRVVELNNALTILRTFKGGSGASTVLTLQGDDLFVRKYSIDSHLSDRLRDQYAWLNVRSDSVPCPRVIKRLDSGSSFIYDMPYDPRYGDFFQYIHSHPTVDSLNMIQRIIGNLEENLYKRTERKVFSGAKKEYLMGKFIKPLERICVDDRIKTIWNSETLIVNGTEFANIGNRLQAVAEECLLPLITDDKSWVIHGDLTVENIICTEDGNYILLDPNPNNILNQKYIDYAKLRQSLNKGYEFLRKTKWVSQDSNRIIFPTEVSEKFVSLSHEYDNFLFDQFGENGTREIRAHEIVNYARLLPYKQIYEPGNILAYFATLVVLVNELEEINH